MALYDIKKVSHIAFDTELGLTNSKADIGVGIPNDMVIMDTSNRT